MSDTKLDLASVSFVLASTMRSVHFACGCFGEYVLPSPYRRTDKAGKEVVVQEWNPHPCMRHKAERLALVAACQRQMPIDNYGGVPNQGADHDSTG